MDNDLIGAVQRSLRGIEVNDETLSYEVIERTVLGPNHYLGAEQTLSLMQTEYLYPKLGDRGRELLLGFCEAVLAEGRLDPLAAEELFR